MTLNTESRRGVLWNEAQQMLAAAEAEARDFTPSEKDHWDVLMSEIDGIDAASKREALNRPEWARNIHNHHTGEQRMENRIEEAAVPVLPTLKELRALSEGTAGAGGYLVPPEQAREILEYLRKRSVFLSQQPRIFKMATDEQVIPKLATSVTVNMVAENAALTPSDPTFEAVTLRPKAAAAFTLVSRHLWDDSTPVSIREALTQDFLASIAYKLDEQFLRGDGSGGVNMTGLRNQSGVTVTSLAANGLSIEIDHVLDGLGRLRANRAGARPIVYLSPRSVNSLLKKKATTNEYLFPVSSAEPPRLGGAPLIVADAIPDNLSHGTSNAASEIIIADMEQVIVGERSSVELAASEDYAFNALQVAMRAWARYDIQLANAAGVEVITGVLA
jgi:HK97 family phage major capsid protein